MSTQEIRITVYEIKRVESGRPVCDNNPFTTTMEMKDKFNTLFEEWHKAKEPSTPLKEFEFLYYQRREDEPESGMTSEMMTSGGNNKQKGTKLKGDQTPEQLHMHDNARIYVKRDNLQCELDEEPMTA
ncbi:uncharacterized protein IL334_004796 [Kwoniella shivajii]|uniref:Uncharacterized protein n=1 Tax=Kwoniella shivajii TaxID=564305 RepID=A0ABZ1D1C1_9TREE|nr:hypothetical protein IL334_004796 [Kwoniella shivajii]